MSKVLVALSGGLDSTVLLASFLEQSYEVETITFNYGAKHASKEIQAAIDISTHYQQRKPRIVELLSLFEHFKSALLQGNKEKLPEENYLHPSMIQTVVPSRNLIFLSIMAGLAESLDIPTIAIAVQKSDWNIYPDCRPLFIHTLREAVQHSSSNKVFLEAPFLHKTKVEIVKLGAELKVPFELTWTCYNGREKACGKCGSCRERLEAFELNGLKDPIEYEEQ